MVVGARHSAIFGLYQHLFMFPTLIYGCRGTAFCHLWWIPKVIDAVPLH
ncbi:hypothetical protein [Microseira wollei]|nr:hypothetical protein [Microseira wollei]